MRKSVAPRGATPAWGFGRGRTRCTAMSLIAVVLTFVMVWSQPAAALLPSSGESPASTSQATMPDRGFRDLVRFPLALHHPESAREAHRLPPEAPRVGGDSASRGHLASTSSVLDHCYEHHRHLGDAERRSCRRKRGLLYHIPPLQRGGRCKLELNHI